MPFSVDADVNASVPALTKFNLDFPGGTPKELVAAIEKAMNKPLNVIISDKDADVRLPPLKLNNVNVSDLFNALQSASTKVESYSAASAYIGIPPSYQQMATSYGFKTDGTVTDDSIWYFVVTKPSVTPEVSPQKICRFYPLAEYLNRGFTVDDITTAIQTGWKMSGDPAKPELNYHKETKLLIAFGEPDKLNVIDEVLEGIATANRRCWSNILRGCWKNGSRKHRLLLLRYHQRQPIRPKKRLANKFQSVVNEQLGRKCSIVWWGERPREPARDKVAPARQ